MDKNILNSLNIGEKVADIQEYYWGTNGERLVYKVTIYTGVKYLLFFKKIKEYTFPFYFVSKEFALEFLKIYENYDFKHFKFYDNIYREYYDGILMFNKNIQNQKFNYKMISAYDKLSTPETKHDALLVDGIWNGLVCSSDFNNMRHWKTDCFNYLCIDIKEQMAAKEGTIGKTYSFKIIEEK